MDIGVIVFQLLVVPFPLIENFFNVNTIGLKWNFILIKTEIAQVILVSDIFEVWVLVSVFVQIPRSIKTSLWLGRCFSRISPLSSELKEADDFSISGSTSLLDEKKKDVWSMP